MDCCIPFFNTLLEFFFLLIFVYVPDYYCSEGFFFSCNVIIDKLLSQSGESALDKTLYKVFSEWDSYSRDADMCMSMAGLKDVSS